jgi:hypothetical protein
MKSLGVTTVLGDKGAFEHFAARRPLPPFSDILIEFASRVSQALLGDKEVRKFPELVALAFWMRRANLQSVVAEQKLRLSGQTVLPRGLVFHIAPANVDTIFVYSWFLSMLCGNKNILRLSSRTTVQQELLTSLVAACLNQADFTVVRERVAVVRYEHSDAITEHFSLAANTRVIWGGDATVAAIRKIALNPLANEVVFANRLSLAVLDVDAFLSADDAAQTDLCRRFANDAYVFGQAACSSPLAVLWRGQKAAARAQRIFWRLVHKSVSAMQHALGPADFINKRVACDRIAAGHDVRIAEETGNLVTRVRMPVRVLQREFSGGDTHCRAGLFYEAEFDAWESIEPLFERRVQTVSYFGIALDELDSMLKEVLPLGIDRIVPIGTALAFSHRWEGLDFFDVFLRKLSLL